MAKTFAESIAKYEKMARVRAENQRKLAKEALRLAIISRDKAKLLAKQSATKEKLAAKQALKHALRAKLQAKQIKMLRKQ